MSQDDIDRLVGDRRLVHESFDDHQVAGFWSKAASAFADAQVAGLSTDTAFQTAYRACLQATLAVLATHGLRVKSTAGHFTAFYTLQKLGDERLRTIAVQFDELRTTRSESVYEPTDDAELAEQLRVALAALAAGLPVLREWITNARPTLRTLLSTPSRVTKNSP
jgi:hypothetical protein